MKKIQSKNQLTGSDLQNLGNLMGGLLDKQSAVLATKEAVEEIKDTIATKLATKEDIKDLKNYIHEGIETVMEGIDNIAEQLTEKQKFERLVEWAKEAGDKIGIKPKI